MEKISAFGPRLKRDKNESLSPINIDGAKESLDTLVRNIENAKLLASKRARGENRALILSRLEQYEKKAVSVRNHYELTSGVSSIGDPFEAVRTLIGDLEEDIENNFLLGIRGYRSRGKVVEKPKYALDIKEMLKADIESLKGNLFEASSTEAEQENDEDENETLSRDIGSMPQELSPDLDLIVFEDRRALRRAFIGDATEAYDPDFLIPVPEEIKDRRDPKKAPRVKFNPSRVINAKEVEVPKPKKFIVPAHAVVVEADGEDLASFEDHQNERQGTYSGTILDRVEMTDEVIEETQQTRSLTERILRAKKTQVVSETIAPHDGGTLVPPETAPIIDPTFVLIDEKYAEENDPIEMGSLEDSGLKIDGKSETVTYYKPERTTLADINEILAASEAPKDTDPREPEHEADEPTEDEPTPAVRRNDENTAPRAIRAESYSDEDTMTKRRGGGGGGGGGGKGPKGSSFWERHKGKILALGAVAATGIAGTTVVTAEYNYLNKMAEDQGGANNTDKPVLIVKADEELPSAPKLETNEQAARAITIQDLLYANPLPGAAPELIDTWPEVLAAQAADQTEAEKDLFVHLPVLERHTTVWDAVESRLTSLNPNVSNFEIISEVDTKLKSVDDLSDNEKLFGGKLKDPAFYEHVKTELLEAGGYDGVFEMVEGEAISINGFLNAPEIAENSALYGKMQRQFAAFLLTQSEIDKLME